VTSGLDCARAQELFSDDEDGTLNQVLRADLAAHLALCADCRALRAALSEVVQALRSHPEVEPSPGLAERAALKALGGRRPPVPVPAHGFLASLRLVAAVLLVGSGVALLVSGPEGAPAQTARRIVDRATYGASYLAERKDRLVEDVRILRVVISAAFEGRLDRVNDRFDDYRRLIEQRAASGQLRPTQERKKVGNKESNSALAELVTTAGAGKERTRT
jgi:hypothetical protein